MNMHEKSLKKLLDIYHTTTARQFSSYGTEVSYRELEYMAAKGWISLIPREPDGYIITMEDKALTYFEDRRAELIRYALPLALSVLAIIISVISIFVSTMPQVQEVVILN